MILPPKLRVKAMTITDEILERGARALCKRRGHNPDWPVGVDKHGYAQEPHVRSVPSWQWFCEADARAVLEAALNGEEER